MLDWQKGRLYLPLEDLERFGYTERQFKEHAFNKAFADLMAFHVARIRQMFLEGTPLIREAPRGLRLELNITLRGGMMILRKIEGIGYDVLHHRPVISLYDMSSIALSALLRPV
jgi:phytoene/squalene synthetase